MERFLEELPNEITFYHVFDDFSLNDALACLQVCRLWSTFDFLSRVYTMCIEDVYILYAGKRLFRPKNLYDKLNKVTSIILLRDTYTHFILPKKFREQITSIMSELYYNEFPNAEQVELTCQILRDIPSFNDNVKKVIFSNTVPEIPFLSARNSLKTSVIVPELVYTCDLSDGYLFKLRIRCKILTLIVTSQNSCFIKFPKEVEVLRLFLAEGPSVTTYLFLALLRLCQYGNLRSVSVNFSFSKLLLTKTDKETILALQEKGVECKFCFETPYELKPTTLSLRATKFEQDNRNNLYVKMIVSEINAFRSIKTKSPLEMFMLDTHRRTNYLHYDLHDANIWFNPQSSPEGNPIGFIKKHYIIKMPHVILEIGYNTEHENAFTIPSKTLPKKERFKRQKRHGKLRVNNIQKQNRKHAGHPGRQRKR